MSRSTKRQHTAKSEEQARFSHEMRTFTAQDMLTHQGELSVSATSMKNARQALRDRLGHTAFIVRSPEYAFFVHTNTLQ